MTIDRSARTAFDEVADLYDEVRPGYPEELIEDILTLSEIPADGRILEVGCGPGNATVPFARRGYSMVCIELGQRLAALATRNCQAYPGVQVLNMSFEDWELEERAFDLVISAEAFHWIPPEIAYPKAAAALNDSGAIALFWIVYLAPQTDLFRAIDEVYRERAPGFENPDASITPEWLIERIVTNLDTSACFAEATVRRYSWSQTYTGGQYVKLLDTISAHRRLDEDTRKELFAAILEAIERFGGHVDKPYLAVLFSAQVRR